MTQTIDILGQDEERTIVAGDAKTLPVSTPNIPEGVHIVEAWFTVRMDPDDEDPALIDKHITVANETGVGQITDDGAESHICTVRVDLTPTDTEAIVLPDHLYDVEGMGYAYDLQLATQAGNPETCLRGLIKAFKQVGRQAPAG